MDNIVEVARFKDPAEAQVLLSLLRSEGIQCNLRNELSTQIMSGYADTGGAILEVLEPDLLRTLEIMKQGGYEVYNPLPEYEKRFAWLSSWTENIPLVKHFSKEARIVILLIAVAFLVTALLYPFLWC